MSDNLTAVLIVLISVLGPVWIVFHYKNKRLSSQQLSAGDTAQMERMAQIAQQLEQRVNALERILDAEVPNWQTNTQAGARYGTGLG